MNDELLAEQQAYYRMRAPEYDEWWQRRGSYDRGPDDAREWALEVAVVESALASFDPSGNVLELAGGTGWWTAQLARSAAQLTVVDGSAEVIALNRARVQRDDVSYIVADLYGWQPDRTYDAVFFSFWLSHVPRSRFSWFWRLVHTCLAPGGRAFLVDNRGDSRRPRVKDPFVVEYRTDEHLRRGSDGSDYRVVKVLYEPDELSSLIAAEGWTAELQGTQRFMFGSAERREL